MARPTSTRAELRRELAVRMSMPYAVRIPNGYADVSAGGATTTIIDTVNLKQANDFWNGQWAYLYDGTNEYLRKITDFVQSTGTLTLESALPGASSTTQDYEIHSKFNAVELHNAINKAIEEAYPAYFDTVESTSLIVKENRLDYLLTAITPQVARMHAVWLERPTYRMYGTVVSATYDGSTNTSIVLDPIDLSTVDTSWMISNYFGTGEGGVLAVVSVNDGTNTVVVAGNYSTWADNDKIQLFDTREQNYSWYPLKNLRFTPKEWPSTMYLYNNISDHAGCRLKVLYSTAPSKLTTETGTTIVPKEFIMLSAMGTLYASRMNDNRVDRQMYATLAAEYSAQADKYKQRTLFRGMDTELWMEQGDTGFTQLDIDGNPMGWR